MNVKILPITTRARNRVREHGEVMVLIKEGYFIGVKAILVESLERTSNSGRSECKWCGWLTKKECSWEYETTNL